MDIIKKISFLMVLIICTACGSGLDEFKKLCEEDAGLIINETVEAEGYYDAYTNCHHCWKELIKSDYQFVEFCAEKDRHPLSYILAEKGCFRVSKVERNGNVCHQGVNKRLLEFKTEPYPVFLKDNCIAVEEIEKPTARYSYHSDFKIWPATNEVSEFTRSDVHIKNMMVNEVIARYVNYSYNEKPGHTTARSCEMFGENYLSFKESDIVNTVIQPIQGVDYD